MSRARESSVRIVICDAYLRHLEDPKGSLAVSRDKNFYSAPKRYNPSGLAYKAVTDVVDGLTSLGYLDVVRGFLDRRTLIGRQTRLVATQLLIDLLESKFHVDDSMIDTHSQAETIVLKDLKKRKVDYRETKFTRSSRALLQDYNRLLRSKYIDINLSGYPNPTRINLGNKFVYRVFNNGSFKQGGRFYGGWWLTIPKELRPRILIRSKPTVELDFSGNQIVMVYANCGIDYFSTSKGDPYSIPGYAPTDRKAIKKATVIALNAPTRKSAQGGLREAIKDGDCVLPGGKTISDLLDDIEAHHVDIRSELYVGKSGYYQFLDSQVAEEVIRYFTCTEKDPVLCIHDSFIVDELIRETLEEQMIKELKATVIRSTRLTSITPDIKDTEAWRLMSTTGVYSGTLVDVDKSPDVHRQQDWYRTKRQGVLTYSPSSP